MALFDEVLWGDLLPGGSGEPEGGEIDVTAVIDGALPTLHANSRANLAHWTEGELIEWADEGLKRISRLACIFVGRVASTLTVATQATYSLPERHVSTLHVSHITQPLRPANTRELEMRNPQFETTLATEAAPISHWYQDLLGAPKFGVTPVPDVSDEPLPVIYNGYPVPVDPGQSLVAAPAPFKGYLSFYVIWQAYQKEGESEMPDVAAHAKARCEMYETIFQGYYGKGM
jgi:hypothetical protein